MTSSKGNEPIGFNGRSKDKMAMSRNRIPVIEHDRPIRGLRYLLWRCMSTLLRYRRSRSIPGL